MDIQQYIKRKKELYNIFLNYIDSNDDYEECYQSLIQYFQPQSNEELQTFLHMILELSKNHHRDSTFFNKIERILLFYEQEIKQTFSNSEIFNLFKNNKRILLFLFNKGLIIPDNQITVLILRQSQKAKEMKFHHFFYPEIKNFIDERWKTKIETELFEYDTNIFELFEEYRKIGENHHYICQLIRNDSVEEFITYVNRSNFPLFATIQPSIFETNSFLLKNKEISLIEYAAFFGSIQIFQYLRLNNIQLNSKLWLYAIHSKSAELIHLLEEYQVEPEDKSYEECLAEAIKCHHNAIKNYIHENIFNGKNISTNIQETCFHFYNFAYFLDNFDKKEHFRYACKYNYLALVKLLLLNNKESNISSKFFLIESLHDAANRNNIDVVNFLLMKMKCEIIPYMFKQCHKLTMIKIPESATEIGFYAFDGCSSLRKISLPSSLTSIGHYSFYDCISLNKIKIPCYVAQIGHSAFEGCSSLKKVTIPSLVKELQKSLFAECSNLTQITIPSSVTSIGDKCFYKCKSLSQITIPSSVASIGEDAFFKCSSLTQLEIPSSVTKIRNNTFRECSSLKQISIPSSVKKIGSRAFMKCSLLTSITLPPLIASIKEEVFNGCSSLSQITIPFSVTKIKNGAFGECSSLTQLTIPSSVTEVCSYAFCRCSSLQQVSIADSVTYLGEFAFKGCSSLKQFSIPSSVTSINDGLFDGCCLLKEITIPSSVIKIGSYSFYGCSSLINVSIPSSVVKIGTRSFYGCSSLSQISVPSSVRFIGEEAFANCSSLKSTDIPRQTTDLKSIE
ncbi:hypothetical protein M9Y10_032150 [Tritrichomonas musculus]|uniref:Surface antigen BspA-like n=1 Tax=Tritrichomonas musculus TaxID=1915356 RepID=A0ABR2GZV9_9EUKA